MQQPPRCLCDQLQLLTPHRSASGRTSCTSFSYCRRVMGQPSDCRAQEDGQRGWPALLLPAPLAAQPHRVLRMWVQAARGARHRPTLQPKPKLVAAARYRACAQAGALATPPRTGLPSRLSRLLLCCSPVAGREGSSSRKLRVV